METTSTINIKPYKNGAVINNQDVITGDISDVLIKAIEKEVKSIYLRSNIRKDKEFTVTIELKTID